MGDVVSFVWRKKKEEIKPGPTVEGTAIVPALRLVPPVEKAERTTTEVALRSDSITVGTSSTRILALNPRRRFAVIVNDSSQDVYIALGKDAALNKGIRINANGGTFSLNIVGDGRIDFDGIVNGIASSSSVVTVTEG